MKKIISLLIVALIAFTSVGVANATVWWAEGNIFEGYFTEPIETSYVVFWDGYILKFTSYENNKIALNYDTFQKSLKEKGRKMEDIAIKIHNHLRSFSFSPGDYRFEGWMREDGFVGSYCLRLPTGSVIYRRDKNEALIQLIRKKGTKKFLKEFKKKYPEAYKELASFVIGQTDDN